ncbi:MAG: hypothetical protein POH28_14610, partial [Acidocella sp.]|nr:hypothetical protein [Acidocella sp.]
RHATGSRPRGLSQRRAFPQSVDRCHSKPSSGMLSVTILDFVHPALVHDVLIIIVLSVLRFPFIVGTLFYRPPLLRMKQSASRITASMGHPPRSGPLTSTVRSAFWIGSMPSTNILRTRLSGLNTSPDRPGIRIMIQH